MAVLIVVLVLTMLTAVAVFAARSAVQNTTNAGRYRQLVQTHSLSDMATTVTIGEVGRNPQQYSIRIEQTPAPTTGQIPCKLATVQRKQCAQLGYQALLGLYQNNLASASFVETKTATRPSTLGFADTRPDFFVELGDNTITPTPSQGFSAGKTLTSTMHFRRITVLAGATVIPDVALGTVTDAGAYQSSMETTRAYALVGPVQ
jgi:hypothetical protein